MKSWGIKNKAGLGIAGICLCTLSCSIGGESVHPGSQSTPQSNVGGVDEVPSRIPPPTPRPQQYESLKGDDWSLSSGAGSIIGAGQVIFGSNILSVRKDPSPNSEFLGAKKEFSNKTGKETSFRMRFLKPMYGADSYVNISINNNLIAEIGVNGLWTFDTNCHLLTGTNRFFIGLAVKRLTSPYDTPTWANDIPVESPEIHNYTDWVKYTVKFEDFKWKVFVNDVEIVYRDVGNFYPEGYFNNNAAIIPIGDENTVKFEAGVLSDGKQTGICSSQESPFNPDTGLDSALFQLDSLYIR